MKIIDFVNKFKSPVLVTFNVDLEHIYIGMKARIVNVFLNDNYVKLEVDFTEFDEYNKSFNLNLRDNGLYSMIDYIYINHINNTPFDIIIQNRKE